MAIYHLHVKILQRSKGRNAVAAAAYRRATKLFDEKEGKAWDYTKKTDVIHTEMLIPENAPQWIKELTDLHQADPSKAAEKLWNRVEASEKRIDSQLAREIEFALPIELNEEQNKNLAREFIKDQFVLRGMAADWNIHWDEGNPHVHVMLTMRELKTEGFGKRVLAWNNRALLNEWRQKWAEYANFHLRLHQHDIKIDHRSYKEQGIDLIPTIHQGKAIADMTHRGISTDIMKEANEIKQENLARITANPNILLDKLTQQSGTFTSQQLIQEVSRYTNTTVIGLKNFENKKDTNSVLTSEEISKILAAIEYHESVFTEKTLAKALGPFSNNTEQFIDAMLQLKSSSELLYLGAGEDGRDRFTTRKMFQIENEIQQITDILRDKSHAHISSRTVNRILSKHQKQIGKKLTDEQLAAVKHILKSSSISCIVGRAGTGKSFSLSAAKAVWEAQGLRVQGITLSGVAADGLTKDASIPSRTIDSFRYAVEKGSLTLTHDDVVVMDEAGMTDSLSMLAVLKIIREAKAKLVLVGDHAQIQPVGPGASFRALLERVGFAEIQTVYRQHEQWQRDATVAFSAGRVADGLSSYEMHGCIHFVKTEQNALSLLVNDWLKTRSEQQKDLSQYLVIAHRNDDVKLLNNLIRMEQVKNGEIAEGYIVNAKQGEMKLAQRDRIIFLKNDRQLGLSNGRFGTVKSVNFTESGNVLDFTILLDGTNKEVCINPKKYNDFAYGYAATVHKVQGMTVDHTFIYAGGAGWNRHLTYVAFSRHRKSCHLYASKDIHRNHQILQRHLSRLGMKDSVLDYPLAFTERRGIDNSTLLKFLPKFLSQRLNTQKEKTIKKAEQQKSKQAEAEKINQRREDARLVASYVDLNRETGIAWQNLQMKLYMMGLDNITYETKIFTLIAKTEEYLKLQSALFARDEIANKIIQEPSRYEKAIEIYEIDLKKLTKQSERYICHERISHYEKMCKSGAVVLRDKLAFEISKDIKKHYPYLQKFEVDRYALRRHGVSHCKRKIFKTLTSSERSSFQLVEKYQLKTQQIGEEFSTYSKTEKNNEKESYKNFMTKRLMKLSCERDFLAYQILRDRNHCDEALDFYQIGNIKSHFGEKLTECNRRKTESRWYKLQQYAARHELRERTNTKQVKSHFNKLNKIKDQNENISKNIIESQSLESLLTKYVEIELEQTHLVNAMHAAKLKDPTKIQELSSKIRSHSSDMRNFLNDVFQHPAIKSEIEKLKNIKPISLAKRGGFSAIYKRISKGEWLREDIQTIVVQLKNKAQAQSRSRAQDKDRGSRTR